MTGEKSGKKKRPMKTTRKEFSEQEKSFTHFSVVGGAVVAELSSYNVLLLKKVRLLPS